MPKIKLVDSDGFVQVVDTRRKQISPKCTGKNSATPAETNSKIQVDLETVVLALYKRMDEHHSIFLKSAKREILRVLENVHHILCIGLGSFSTSHYSRWQLAFLLHMGKWFPGAKVYVCDPAFSVSESQHLVNALKFEVISDNFGGNHTLPEKGNTLVYMPSTPLSVRENLMKANRREHRLKKAIVLGNVSKAGSSMLKDFPSLNWSLNVCEEVDIEGVEDLPREAFYKLSLQWFPSEKFDVESDICDSVAFERLSLYDPSKQTSSK